MYYISLWTFRKYFKVARCKVNFDGRRKFVILSINGVKMIDDDVVSNSHDKCITSSN